MEQARDRRLKPLLGDTASQSAIIQADFEGKLPSKNTFISVKLVKMHFTMHFARTTQNGVVTVVEMPPAITAAAILSSVWRNVPCV